MSRLLLALVVSVGALQPGGVDVLARHNMSNVEDARTAVASSPDEWAALWRSHAGDKPPPTVDFTTGRVIAIFLGSRPTAGYEIEISGTKQEGSTLIVEWTEVRPKAGVMLAQVLTSPALFASISRSGEQVGFRKVVK